MIDDRCRFDVCWWAQARACINGIFTMLNRQQFAQNYGKLVAKVWSDPKFLSQLKSSPASVLNQNGIETHPGAKIYVVQMEPTGDGSVDRQVNDWVQGDATGVYHLWLPAKPSNLGGDVSADDTSTTCTPCSTCT
jgi:hypothetical protein